ncbi:MAG: metal ABC transporter ATP-binding protein [Candidatus Sulfotelmatobacter sp.]
MQELAKTILSVKGLTVNLEGRSILSGLSFELHAGEMLAIIGPNGAGKTVLLRTLLHILPYQGEVKWMEGARIGYVPQRVAADRQLPLSANDLLNAKARFLKLNQADVARAVSTTNLTPELLNANIGILSGGQFQRILIAAALLGRPNVILFDEPTASLDELTEERVYDLLHRIQEEQNISVVLVSHDLSVVYRNATTVLCVGKGKPCFGPPKEVLTPEALEALYSAPPKYYQHLQEHHGV